jgi:hypothetical protein
LSGDAVERRSFKGDALGPASTGKKPVGFYVDMDVDN